MAKNGHKTNWLLDVALFAGLLLSFWLDLTGVGWHQWLGVGLGVLIGYHFLAHWKWVETIGGRFFGRLPRQPRLYFVIDLALLLGFYLIGLTGLVISTWLGLELSNYAAWRNIHVGVSVATLGLVVVKIGLHQGWIVSAARRYFGRRGEASTGRSAALWPPASVEHTQLVPVTARPSASSRRDFLILMGIVGAASALSAFGALHDPAASAATATGEPAGAETATEWTAQAGTQAGASSSSACAGRCERRCAYPGHCHRYRDADGDGRCDWGECA